MDVSVVVGVCVLLGVNTCERVRVIVCEPLCVRETVCDWDGVGVLLAVECCEPDFETVRVGF